MELNIKKQPIAVSELMLAATAEHPIECDVLLPDYCPDIVRVLCCQVEGAVTDTAVRGNVFTVEGMATVTLCYLGEVGGVRKTEYRLPFSKSFELSGEPADPVYTVAVDQGYLNCRAASKRRLDIRGTLLISVRLYDTSERQVVSAAEGMGVQLRTGENEATRAGGQAIRHFSVADELSAPAGKQAVAEVVRADCRPVVQEARLVAGRVVLKGELLVHLLYKTDLESGQLETADYTLPLGQMLEVDSASEDDQCEVELTCTLVECTMEESGDAAGRIRLEAQFTALLRFYRPVVLSGATDSYSTLYQSDHTVRKFKVLKSYAPVSERTVVRTEAELPQDSEGVLDVWAIPTKAAARVEGNAMTATCLLTFIVFVRSAEKGVDSMVHAVEVTTGLAPAGQAESVEYVPRFSVLGVSVADTGGKAQLTAQLLVGGAMLTFVTQSVLTDLTVDENSPKKLDPAIGLLIYFAQAGENIWDISKRYGALPAQVLADNGLTCEVIEEDTALMIPAV